MYIAKNFNSEYVVPTIEFWADRKLTNYELNVVSYIIKEVDAELHYYGIDYESEAISRILDTLGITITKIFEN